MNMPAVPKALTEQEVESRIRVWHTAADMDADVHLHDYLGWSWDEYVRWVETGEMPNA